MTHRTFTRLEEFIASARTGDIYYEEAPNGRGILTFRAKSHCNGSDNLRAERLSTDLITRGIRDYTYRTLARTGTLFTTRDRYGNPAFLGTSAQERFVSLVEVAHFEHSQAEFVAYHVNTMRDHFNLNEQKVPA